MDAEPSDIVTVSAFLTPRLISACREDARTRAIVVEREVEAFATKLTEVLTFGPDVTEVEQ